MELIKRDREKCGERRAREKKPAGNEGSLMDSVDVIGCKKRNSFRLSEAKPAVGFPGGWADWSIALKSCGVMRSGMVSLNRWFTSDKFVIVLIR